MNGISARLDICHSDRAASSLPQPVSPRISTVASVGATIARKRCTSCIGGDEPTSTLGPSAFCTRLSSARFLLRRSRLSAMRVRTASMSASLHGLVM